MKRFTLIPMLIEKPSLVRGRPSYRWVTAFLIECPDGSVLYPPVMKREAIRLIRRDCPKALIVVKGGAK